MPGRFTTHPTEDALRRDLAQAKARREAAAQMVDRILDLLKRADERRLREPKEARRWNSVLDHLETSLGEARARLGRIESDVAQWEAELAGAKSGPTSPGLHPIPEPPPPPPPAPTPPVLSQEPREAAQQLLAFDLDQLASLTMEQVSQLHSHLREGAVPGAIEEMERVAGRLEIANQSPAPPMEQGERRGQELLRRAVGRLQLGEAARLGHAEAALVLSCCELLDRKLSPTPSDLRLKSLLEPFLPALRARVEETRA